jgi:hypothetical protein
MDTNVTQRTNSSLPPETTPEKLTDQIETLCRKIDSDQSPTYVPVVPVSEAKPGECVYNVKTHISTNGGKMVLGWCIWERPGINLNAEFHAVWKSPDSKLVDITPKPDGETKVLFLHDSKLVWKGERYPCQLVALEYWSEVTKWFAAMRRYHKLNQPGTNVIDKNGLTHANKQLSDAIKKLEKKYSKHHQ